MLFFFFLKKKQENNYDAHGFFFINKYTCFHNYMMVILLCIVMTLDCKIQQKKVSIFECFLFSASSIIAIVKNILLRIQISDVVLTRERVRKKHKQVRKGL